MMTNIFKEQKKYFSYKNHREENLEILKWPFYRAAKPNSV